MNASDFDPNDRPELLIRPAQIVSVNGRRFPVQEQRAQVQVRRSWDRRTANEEFMDETLAVAPREPGVAVPQTASRPHGCRGGS